MRAILKGFVLCAVITGAAFSQDATGWPHKNAAGQTVRHVIIMNHLNKAFTLELSGYANRTMNPGDSIVLEHAFGWASARCSGTYPGTTNMGSLSLAEWTMGSNNNDDWYDVSLVDGYNLPVRMFPVKGTFTTSTAAYMCDTVGCTKDLLPNCPPELQVKSSDGTLIQCLSACAKFHADSFCCSGAYSVPQTCHATAYSKLFKDACPWAYSYAYDDLASLDQCTYANGIGPDYVIEFGYFQDQSAVSWKPGFSISGIASCKIGTTENNVLQYAVTGLHSGHVKLALYSCTGRLVSETIVSSSSGVIPLSGITKGIYIAVLKSDRSLLAQQTVAIK
jgi:Thaumatin family